MMRRVSFLCRLFKSTLGVDLRDVFQAGMSAERDCLLQVLRGSWNLHEDDMAHVLDRLDLLAKKYRDSTPFLNEREKRYRFFKKRMK